MLQSWLYLSVSGVTCCAVCRPEKPSTCDWVSHYPLLARKASLQANQNSKVETTTADGDTEAEAKRDVEALAAEDHVSFVDVGCGFGGMSVTLAKMFPTKLVLGMEIRDKVSEYVRERILHLRQEHPGTHETERTAIELLPKSELQGLAFASRRKTPVTEYTFCPLGTFV